VFRYFQVFSALVMHIHPDSLCSTFHPSTLQKSLRGGWNKLERKAGITWKVVPGKGWNDLERYIPTPL
jgi:hypothetical protein